mgnify:CR=1 FL=1
MSDAVTGKLIFLPVRVANDVVSPFFKPRIALPRGAFSG